MKKRIKRILEIVAGVFLILLGVVMFATPGPGVIAVAAGVFLISPQHGRRVFWWARQFFRKIKSWFYSLRFRRTVRRKFWNRARALRKKLSKK